MDDSEPPPLTDPRRLLAHSPRKEEILDESLVLASQWLKHWIEFDGKDFRLSVEERDFAAAQELLDTYRQENAGFHETAPTPGTLELYLTPLLFLAIPVLCYFWVGLQPGANWLIGRGSADARLMLAGEWWRSLTATTLHADNGHFLSNLVSGYFILNLLNHRVGIGTAMVVASLGAGLTNCLVALASGPGHVSIGFSTVVFCSLGMLAALESLHLPRRREKNMRRLTPLISAFFIAVMVGLGENADVKAHFYGFGIGALLGVACPRLPRRLSRPAWQAALALFTYGLYAGAWALAIHGG